MDGVYTTVKAGHLTYGEKRLRLWGVCRHDSVNVDTAARIRKMGFNAIRLWGPVNGYDSDSAARGKLSAAPVGDPGKDAGLDRFDRFFAACKQEGLFVLFPSLHYYEGGVFKAEPGALADGSFVSGGADWGAWKAALADKEVRRYYRFFRYFDPRIRKINFAHAAGILSHVNPYTKRAYAEEEAIATYEVENENGFLSWFPEQGAEKWPAFFREELAARWNAWLGARYASGEKLLAAWGRVEEGEDWASGNLALKPLFAERNKYPAARGADLMRFLVELVGEYNEAFRAHCRSLAPAGKGAAVVPFSFDTQFKNTLPWLYANAKADVTHAGIYQWALTSSLTAPPSMYVVDGNTVEGKPLIIYEINTSRPNPARAEFPMRLAAFASWQDWDGVFWHYWNEAGAKGDARFQLPRAIPDREYLESPLPILDKSDAIGDTGFTHATDPVMCASLALAGRLFLGFHLAPSPAPSRVQVGDDLVFGYDGFSGIKQTRAAFARGARISFAGPAVRGSKIDGEPLSEQVSEAVASGEEILWDWPNGRLLIDTPTAKAYVGPTDGLPYRFKDGIVLAKASGVPFVTFALASADGRPLTGPQASTRMLVNAVYDARNTGFDFDFSGAPANGGFIGPSAQGARTKQKGAAPVIQDKVGLELAFPTRVDYAWEGFDFALGKCASKKEKDARAVMTGEEAVYMGVLTVERRGAVQDGAQSAAVSTRRSGTAPSAKGAAFAPSGLWNPLPGVDWNQDYASAHQALRDGNLLRSSISRFDDSPRAEKRITLSEAQVIFKSSADVELAFDQGGLARIAYTFTQPPPLAQLLAAWEKEFGAPKEKAIATEAYSTSRVRWIVPGKGPGLVEILVTETQGNLGVRFTRGR
ncbi:MAG: hypothetical protein J0L75_12385 [Spirochaetes bacterium]|nr:hypothetical protein [Spirochaetota bacterium]